MLLGFTLAQRAIFCPENENNFQRSRPRILSEVRTPTTYHKLIWLVVSTPLQNISQLGWLFPICINLSTCSKCHLGHWVQVEMIQTYAGFTWGIYFIFTQSCGTRSPGIFLFLILLAEGRTEGELSVFFSPMDMSYWLVVEPPLWKIWVRQLGLLFHLFPIYGKF